MLEIKIMLKYFAVEWIRTSEREDNVKKLEQFNPTGPKAKQKYEDISKKNSKIYRALWKVQL